MRKLYNHRPSFAIARLSLLCPIVQFTATDTLASCS